MMLLLQISQLLFQGATNALTFGHIDLLKLFVLKLYNNKKGGRSLLGWFRYYALFVFRHYQLCISTAPSDCQTALIFIVYKTHAQAE